MRSYAKHPSYPLRPAGFTGHTDELAELMSLLDQPPPGEAVVISVVDGTAGCCSSHLLRFYELVGHLLTAAPASGSKRSVIG